MFFLLRSVGLTSKKVTWLLAREQIKQKILEIFGGFCFASVSEK